MNTQESRVLALAGLAQALQVVRRIADTGHSDQAATRALMQSVFAMDAPSVEAVYGSARDMRPGLLRLRAQLVEGSTDQAFTRLAMSVMALERTFTRSRDVAEAVRNALTRIPRPPADAVASPDVIAALAEIYATHISPLKPRVMVQGNPHYLAQDHVVAEIRAILLAALRSAVLWRQLGGSGLEFVFGRKAMAAAVDNLLD